MLGLVSSARVGFCVGSLVETGVLLGLGKGVEVESGMVFLFRTVSDILMSWFFWGCLFLNINFYIEFKGAMYHFLLVVFERDKDAACRSS